MDETQIYIEWFWFWTDRYSCHTLKIPFKQNLQNADS